MEVTMPYRVPTLLRLSAAEQGELEGWARRRKTAQALAQRARIVLQAAAGRSNTAIAAELGVAKHKKPIIKSVEFAISVPGVRQADRQAGRSLSAILDAPLPRGLSVLTIHMSSAGTMKDELDRNAAMEIVHNLRQFGGEVRRLFVRAKGAERAKTEK
jgi:hypothetical protein